MAQADDNRVMPPGVECVYAFDLIAAIQSVYEKVPSEFQGYERWNKMLGFVFEQAITMLATSDEHVKEYSLLYIQLNFLKRLWDHLFGVVGGPSPWHFIIAEVNRRAKNGQNDKVISIDELVQLSQERVTRDVSNTIAFGRTSQRHGETPPQIGIDDVVTMGIISGYTTVTM